MWYVVASCECGLLLFDAVVVWFVVVWRCCCVVNCCVVLVGQTWSPPAGRQPKLIKRSEPIVVKRVPSVFAVEKEEAKTEESQSCSSQSMGEEGTVGLGKLSDSDTARDSSSEDEGKVANGEDGRDEEYIDYDWEVRMRGGEDEGRV